jgi:hypothetical protein
MTWIYIPDSTSSTVSADTADSPSASDSPTRTPASRRSPISSGTDIASKSSRLGSKTATSMTLPSGTISKVSTADPGVERWISSLRDSPANRIQTPGFKNAKTIPGISGAIPSESFAKWNPDSLSWKTSPDWQPPQDSISKYLKSNGNSVYLTKTITSRTQGPSIVVISRLMDTHTWDELSGTFPTSITMRNGTLSVRPTPRLPICAGGGGSWHIPTPTSADVYTGKGEGLSKTVKMFPTPRAGKTTDEDEESTPPLDMAVRMFPTPTSRDHKDGDAHSCQNVPVNGLLVREVHMLPTPKTTDWKDSGTSQKAIDREAAHFNLWGVVSKLNQIPTPSSGGDSGGPHGIRGGSWAKEKLVETFGEEDAVAMSGGSLSPDWVEWLMGIPLGWSSMQPLSSDEYLYWFHAQQDGTWWQIERGLPRVAVGIANRVNRLRCLGNGIVPASLSLFLRGTR